MVIQLFFTTKLVVFEVKTGILCNNILLDHHNNVLIVFCYTCISAQVEYERTHARTRVYQRFHFKDAHAFTNDLLSTFSN